MEGDESIRGPCTAAKLVQRTSWKLVFTKLLRVRCEEVDEGVSMLSTSIPLAQLPVRGLRRTPLLWGGAAGACAPRRVLLGHHKHDALVIVGLCKTFFQNTSRGQKDTNDIVLYISLSLAIRSGSRWAEK